MAIIDADAHVVENEKTWSYASTEDKNLMPALINIEGRTGRNATFWAIDGRLVSTGPVSETDAVKADRELDDVQARVRHMDELGTNIQVIFPTIFLRPLTSKPELELALSRSYNRWLAERCQQAPERLRWAVIPPTMNVDASIEELRFGKEHGACAVFWRGFERDMQPGNPYFYPIYEEAQRLDMAIAVHIANGNPAMTRLYKSNRSPGGGFSTFRAPTVMACQQVLMSELPQVFPTLRWGFIEASANWVPWVVSDVRERYEVAGRPVPDYPLEANRVYVTCQTNDDLPFVLKHAGERSIVIGTDYGHIDPSSELDAITVLREQSGLPQETIMRIVDANPRALYGLDGGTSLH